MLSANLLENQNRESPLWSLRPVTAARMQKGRTSFSFFFFFIHLWVHRTNGLSLNPLSASGPQTVIANEQTKLKIDMNEYYE